MTAVCCFDFPVFSTCAWATGRALGQDPRTLGWLDGFEEAAGSWAARAAGLGEAPALGTDVPASRGIDRTSSRRSPRTRTKRTWKTKTKGKEADVVILILGTDPRRPGARAWAASRPNLLNVAVSRAKRRLFVIGNRESWRDQRHFTTLADALPAHNWQP